jgi:hypothetical protein
MSKKLYFTNTIPIKEAQKINEQVLKDSKRYCNAICQEIKPLTEFFTNFEKFYHCKKCHSYLTLAQKMVKHKQITIQQFIENPDIVHGKKPVIPEGTKKCTTCEIEKSFEDFDYNRKVCKSCRHSMSVQRTAEGVKTNITEIEKLKDNIEGLKKYLLYLPSHVLIEVSKIFKVGRKSTDHKDSMITNIINHFTKLQNPKICIGGCGNTLQEIHSCCDACKKTPKKMLIVEENGKFEQNLPEFLKTFKGLKPEEECNYNVPKLIMVARALGIVVNTLKGSTKRKIIDSINEKIQKNKEELQKQEEKILEEMLEDQKEIEPLVLNDGFQLTYRKSDGYVDVTNLCKAGGKLFADWQRLQRTKDFLKELEIVMGIPITELLTIKQGGINQGTWTHPQVAINIAQWISPKFDVLVSKWVYEILLTGKVDVTTQRSSHELLSLRQELVAERQARKKIEENHNKLLKKREYHKFKKGSAFYIISDNDSKSYKCKPGIDREDVNVRLQQHRSTTPSIKVEYLLYTDKCSLIETAILERYSTNRNFSNHEWIFDVSVTEIIASVKILLNFLCIEYTEEKELDEYNSQIESPCE